MAISPTDLNGVPSTPYQPENIEKKPSLPTPASAVDSLHISLQLQDQRLLERKKKRKELYGVCKAENCRKILSVIDKIKSCRCGNAFCGEHQHSGNHNCTFDYKKLGKEELEKKLKPKEGKRAKIEYQKPDSNAAC